MTMASNNDSFKSLCLGKLSEGVASHHARSDSEGELGKRRSVRASLVPSRFVTIHIVNADQLYGTYHG
jgi:hypothetical protein